MSITTEQMEEIRACSKDEAAYGNLLALCEAIVADTQSRAQQRFDDIASNIPGMVYRLRYNPDGQPFFEYVSPRCQALNGISAEAAMNDANLLINLIEPSRREEYITKVTASAQNLTPFFWEDTIVVDGETRWRRIESRPKRLLDGSTVWDGIQLDVTREKQSEAALWEIRQRYNELAANIPGMVYQLRLNGEGQFQFDYVSPRCLELNGFPAEAVMADSSLLLNTIAPERRAEYAEKAIQSFQLNDSFIWEDSYEVNGSLRWRRLESRPKPMPDGSIVWDGIQIDITTQKQTEQALQESQRFSQQITAMVPNIVYVYDMIDQQSVYVNPAIEMILGYHPDEIYWMAENLLETVMHPDDFPRQRAGMSRFHEAADGEIITSEYRWQHKNGDYRWIQVQDVIFKREGDGSPRLILGVAQDITERKLSELALRASEQRFRALAENSPDYIYIHDMNERRAVYFNRSSFLGYTEAELSQPGSIGFAMHPDDRDSMKTYMANLYAGQLPLPAAIEARIQARDGNWHWVQKRHTLFATDARGTPTQYLTTISIIDERKRTETLALEQERLNTELFKERELNQIKTLMMVRISHEFRTPLAVISSSSEMLERYYDRMEPERRLERLRQIREEVTRITRMLEDIGLVLRQQSSDKPEYTPVDVEGLCADRIAKIQAGLGAKHIFRLHSDNQFQQIEADAFLLTHIISNLLSNAVKFSAPGTTITVNLRLVGGMMSLSVHDEGYGILDVDRTRIFEPFYRGRNIGEVSGIGLGLSIVKDAIEMHGGRIEVESSRGAGTTFTAWLPVKPAH